MIDRFKIKTPSLQICPKVITAWEAFATKHRLTDYAVNDRASKRGDAKTATIQLLPNNALRLYAQKRGNRWVLLNIEGNAVSVLDGHNGGTISADIELAAPFARVKALVNLCLEPGQEHLIVPGIHPECRAYFSMLEINCHIADPAAGVISLWNNLSHPGIRKAAMRCEGESITLKGTSLQIDLYRKDVQMRKTLRKFGCQESQLPVTRAEIRLAGQKLAHYFTTPRNLAMIDGKPRVVRFSIADLRKVFLEVMGETTGVFGTSACVKQKGLSAFFAALSINHGIPLDTLIATYRDTRGVTKVQAQRVVRQARKILDSLDPVRIEDVFSDDAFHSQPQVPVPELEERLEVTRQHFRSNCREIWEIYSGVNETSLSETHALVQYLSAVGG